MSSSPTFSDTSSKKCRNSTPVGVELNGSTSFRSCSSNLVTPSTTKNFVSAKEVRRVEAVTAAVDKDGTNNTVVDLTTKSVVPNKHRTKSHCSNVPITMQRSVKKGLQKHSLNFKINVECTSLRISPSGNFLWGGFSDGSLRVFDLSGTFAMCNKSVTVDAAIHKKSGRPYFNSKFHQSYGAVACQIHARGVHTDLITTVDIAPNGKYVFCGVSRGAMELYAVNVEALERIVRKVQAKRRKNKTHGMIDPEQVQRSEEPLNILDYIQVYCHSDAKLKGFGACTDMIIQDTASNSISYLLLTGKGIKNIHIWKFTPPSQPTILKNETSTTDEEHGDWEQLYDTSTNGNTILLLNFYRTPNGKLMAISKSDVQKLRLWDLSYEEDQSQNKRPKRPPYQDVDNSQSALGIAGGFCVCGGDSMYNELSIVSLEQPNNAYNHTELALPKAAANVAPSPIFGLPSSASRRQRRGEMKAVVNVATSPQDASHALLELDDGSLIQYSAGVNDTHHLPKLSIVTSESTGIPALPAEFWRRSLCLENVCGIVMVASSCYNPNNNKGQIAIRAIEGMDRILAKSSGKIPETALSHKGPPQSPVEADSQALRNAKQAPPSSIQRTKRTKKRNVEAVHTAAELTSFMAKPNFKEIVGAASARVSPEKDLQIPVRLLQSLNATPTAVVETTAPPLKFQTKSVQEPNKSNEAEQESEVLSKSQLSWKRKERIMASSMSDAVVRAPKAVKLDVRLPEQSSFSKPDSALWPSLVPIKFQVKSVQELRTSNETGQQSEALSKSKYSMKRKEKVMSFSMSDALLRAPKVVKLDATPPEQSRLSNPNSVVGPTMVPAIFQTKSAQEPKKNSNEAEQESEVQSTSQLSIKRKEEKISYSIPDVVVKAPKAVEVDAILPGKPTFSKQQPASTTEAQNSEKPETAFLISMTATIPISRTEQVSTNRMSFDGNSEAKLSAIDIAPLFENLRAPFVNANVCEASKESGISHEHLPPCQVKQIRQFKGVTTSDSSPGLLTPKQTTHTQAPKVAFLRDKVFFHYKTVQELLKSVTKKSNSLMRRRNSRGPVLLTVFTKETPEQQYKDLTKEHRAAHNNLEKHLLRSAETTLRLVLDDDIAAEEARADLKASIKRFEEILFDTLHRQQLETESLLARNPRLKKNIKSHVGPKPATYPCQSIFERVEEACTAFSRPVGRPKSTVSPP